MNITLNKYQNEAWNTILESYKANKKFTLLVMPQGSGKHILSIYAVQELSKLYQLKKVAFISRTLALKDNFMQIINRYEIADLVDISLYTYNSLLDNIDNKRINKNEFDLVIFDDFDYFKNSGRLDKISRNLDVFHIYFSNTRLDSASTKLSLSLDNGLIYEISIQEIINNGYYIDFQRKFYNEININVNKQIEYYSKHRIDQNEFETRLNDLLETLNNSNEELFKVQNLILSGEIGIEEVNELSFRKKQVAIFEKLLNDNDFFDSKVKPTRGNEAVWQEFFETNPWIFGFSLNYIFNSPLEGNRLEQTVKGFDFNSSGKRVDALLRTTGFLQTLCFGEIKTHRTQLLKNLKSPYRADSWSISDELAGGIAQIHKTIQKSSENLAASIPIYDSKGFRSQKSIYLYRPKSFLIIGSLNEFANEKGEIHEEKFSSFELFRKSIADIEIITFDELYERANAIINKKWNS